MRATLRPVSLISWKWSSSTLAQWRWQHIVVALLVVLNLTTAFALVYTKDMHRRLFIQYQGLQMTHLLQSNQWSKLLLEQSTWSSQSRVQQLATTRLGMVSPNPHKIVMVSEAK